MTSTAIEETAASRGVGTLNHPPIPFSRLLKVELRKMFDTRSGFRLMAGIVILAIIATGATMIFGHRSTLEYGKFAAAVGIPTTVILPVLGALAVSSEWGQRTALTTFTLVPSRARVILAKLLVVIAVGIASVATAFAVAVLGNLLNAAIAGITPVWNVSFGEILKIVLADGIGMLMGFMLGALFRSSAAAVVGYFVYELVLPGISGALASAQPWWHHNAAWFDLRTATIPLYDHGMTAHQWAQLSVSTLIWLVIPLAIAMRLVLRSEVK